MADNVGYTPGTGTLVASDEVTYSGDTTKVQLVKPVLVTGTEGSKTLTELPGDGTYGLDVDVTRLPSLPAGTNAIGTVVVSDGVQTISIDASQSDGESNAANSLHTSSRSYVFNGTTWDRVRGDVTNGLDVDVTRLPALVAGTAYVGKVRITDGTNDLTVDTVHSDGESSTENHLDVAAKQMLYNGATWDMMRGDITNGLDVDVTRVTGTVAVAGNVASGSADSGNPVKMGGQARTTNRTAVTDGQRTDFIADDLGRQIVVMNQVRDLVTQSTTTISTTTETTVLAAGAAGVFHDLTLLMMTNTGNTATRVDIRDATAGTVRFSVWLPAAGGGVVLQPPVPITATGAAANWTAQLSAATTDVRIFVQAIKNV
jgi:hypothetical protein